MMPRNETYTPRLARNDRLASAAVGLFAIFVAACALMHFVQSDLSPVDDAVSYYMNGRLGWILGLGLLALGAGSLLLARGLHLIIGTGGSRLGILCLVLWGAGVVAGGIFPPDPRGQWNEPPSMSGIIHGGAAMTAFMAFPVAALLLSKKVHALSGAALSISLKPVAAFGAVCLVAFFVCLAPVFRNRPPLWLGLVERTLLVAYIAWLVTAAFALRSAGRQRPTLRVR